MRSRRVFTLRGEFFELPLPQGWRAHPEKMDDIGAVADRYELIVATATVDMEKAAAAGVGYEYLHRRMAETRREAALALATSPSDVEEPQFRVVPLHVAPSPGSQDVATQAPVALIRGRLSQEPLAGCTLFVAVIGAPGIRAGTTSKRPFLTLSLYGYAGPTLDEHEAFAAQIFGPLELIEAR